MLAVIAACWGVTGCGGPRAEIDCRLVDDPALLSALNGPRYHIIAPNEAMIASLEFADFAGHVAEGLRRERPELHRVGLDEPAELQILMHYQVADRGVGVRSYSTGGGWVYARAYGQPGWYPYGPMSTTQVETFHLGYIHSLFLAASLPRPDQPGGRLVLWEGSASTVVDVASLRLTIPHLARLLTGYYGQATPVPESVGLEDEPEEEDHAKEREKDRRGSKRKHQEEDAASFEE